MDNLELLINTAHILIDMLDKELSKISTEIRKANKRVESYNG